MGTIMFNCTILQDMGQGKTHLKKSVLGTHNGLDHEKIYFIHFGLHSYSMSYILSCLKPLTSTIETTSL